MEPPLEQRLELPTDRPLTVADLVDTPDDGRRYELVDGRLDVSAAPVGLHTRAEFRLGWHLINAAPEEIFEVHGGPGIVLNDTRTAHRVPDIAVIRTEYFELPYQTRPPVLAVEVLSPESVFRDTEQKRREYADFGIESYWIVNPSLEKPGVSVLWLQDGRYREVAQVYGKDVFATDVPFPIRLVPEWLVADGPWKANIGGPTEDANGSGSSGTAANGTTGSEGSG
ncbi:MAG: Uma2 family endonuclease [Nocardiopsaceae bacterium]|nr:Uma2 family endonuclease [Nocardiopsaceae bacterium]